MSNLADLLGRVAPPRGPRPSVAPTAIATDTRGVAALELALTIPFMILLLMGIFDFGTFAYDSMQVKAAAYAGAAAAVSAVQSGGSCSPALITTAEQNATPLLTNIAASNGLAGARALGPNCTYTGYVNTSSSGANTLSTSCTQTCSAPAPGTYAAAYAQTSFSPLLSWSGLVLPSTISASAMVRYQ